MNKRIAAGRKVDSQTVFFADGVFSTIGFLSSSESEKSGSLSSSSLLIFVSSLSGSSSSMSAEKSGALNVHRINRKGSSREFTLGGDGIDLRGLQYCSNLRLLIVSVVYTKKNNLMHLSIKLLRY